MLVNHRETISASASDSPSRNSSGSTPKIQTACSLNTSSKNLTLRPETIFEDENSNSLCTGFQFRVRAQTVHSTRPTALGKYKKNYLHLPEKYETSSSPQRRWFCPSLNCKLAISPGLRGGSGKGFTDLDCNFFDLLRYAFVFF